MRVGTDYNTTGSDYKRPETSLKRAIQDYKDEMLTGLTEDEREEYEKLCREYLKERPIESQADHEAFLAYAKSILVDFGYKGDVNEYASYSVAAAHGDGQAEAVEAKSPLVKTKDTGSSQSQVISENGQKYILITMGNGMKFKIKISNAAENTSGDPQPSIEKVKPQMLKQAAGAYDKSFMFAFEKADA